MTRIECRCKTCTANAATLGVTVLAAEVPEQSVHMDAHAVVYWTNQPGPVGARFRATTGTRVA